MGYFWVGIGLAGLVAGLASVLAISLSVLAGRTADAETHLQTIGGFRRDAFRPPTPECLDKGCPCFWEARTVV